LIVAAMLTGCAAQPVDIYWWAPGADEGQLAALTESCERWNAVADRKQYVATSADEATHTILFRPREEIPGAKAGLYDPATETAYVSTGVVGEQGERRAMAIMHEQGHALGLAPNDVHPEGVGVMTAHGMTGRPVLTTVDMAECRRVGVCR
jgi:hypothetical protein